MFKLFNKKRGKKGFTLAELLVVVAIIAILVAIAIPIFSHSVEDAKTAVKNANIRAVRAAAVEQILTDWTRYGYVDSDTSKPAKSWSAKAVVSATGDITSDIEITPSEDTTPSGVTEQAVEANGGYQVTVVLTQIATGTSAGF